MLPRDTILMFSAHKPRCLVVEDVEAMRTLLCAVLESTGCDIVGAASLRDARRILRSQVGTLFDFVILDLELPDGSGLELLPELFGEVKVIALTADDSQETYLQCLNAGCDEVLSKSDELTKLKSILTGTSVSKMSTCPTTPDSGYTYIRYLAETRLELQEARRTTDFLSLRRIVHRLRGTAIHFGHPGISRAAKSISVAIAAGQPSQVSEEIDVLNSCIGEALTTYHLRAHFLTDRETVACES